MRKPNKDILISLLLGLAVTLLVYICLNSIANLQREKNIREYENKLSNNLASIKSNIEVEISKKVYLANGVASLVRFNPTIGQDEFSAFAQQVLLNSGEPIRCIQLVKDSIISHVYPIQTNENVLGVNLFSALGNREVFMQSVNNKTPMTSGPRKLIQGGLGLIYRLPIFIPSSEENEKEKFWGFSAVIIDVDSLLNEINLLQDSSLDFAIKAIKANDQIIHFYGDSTLFNNARITKTIVASDNEWQITAKPVNGWKSIEELPIILYILGWLFCIFSGIIASMLCISYIRLKKLNRDLLKKNNTIQLQIDEKGVLIKEIHHRVKNHFQMVSSIARIQAYITKNPETLAVLKEMENRIRSFSTAHEQLYKSEGETTNLKQYILTLVHQLVDNKVEKVKITSEIEEIEIPFKNSVYLGIIINELITNSLKHAFKNKSGEKEIYLSVAIKDNMYELKYLDNGVGIPKETFEKTENSFGLELIKMMTEQLMGTINQINSDDFSGILLLWK